MSFVININFLCFSHVPCSKSNPSNKHRKKQQAQLGKQIKLSPILLLPFLICLVGGGVQLGPLSTAATDCSLRRVILMMENLVG
jgi:hypothetical protein